MQVYPCVHEYAQIFVGVCAGVQGFLQVRAGVRHLNGMGGSLCLDLLDEDEIADLVKADLRKGVA